jgi:ubiquitin carboxyl-terminal hydrolase 14
LVAELLVSNNAFEQKVIFPVRLDMYAFCTEELQKELSVYRDAIDKKFDEEAEKPGDSDKMDVDEVKGPAPIPHPTDFVQSGVYELFGVITHKGRFANSGHYIGWTRDGNSGMISFSLFKLFIIFFNI